MKSLFTLLLFAAIATHTQAQSSAKEPQGTLVVKNATSATTAEQLTKTATLTGRTFKASDGTVFQVWQSSKGSLFIVRKSKKTGNYYKQYLKEQ